MDKLKLKSGFSTLEMLIAMAVLVILLGAIMLVTFGNQSILIDSETSSEALNKAQEMLEKEQSLSRKDFRLVNSDTSTTTDGIYQKRTWVKYSDVFTKNVLTLITWNGDHNRAHSTSLNTLVTNFENATGGDTCYSTPSGDWTKPVLLSSTNIGTLIINDTSGSYPITDMEIFQKKLFVTVNSSSQSVGPNNPTTATVITGAGSVAWSNPNNIFTGSNSSSVSASSLNNTNSTQFLRASNFGFSVPLGATIVGIKVEVQKSRTGGSSGNIVDSQVRIVKSNGAIGSINKADTATSWPSTESYISYGSNTDMWGEKWSASDINNSNFGVVISATGSSGGNRLAQIDHVRITVTYVKQLYVLDISNPSSPMLTTGMIGSGSVPLVSTGYNAIAIASSSIGSFAYVATNSSNGQLQIIDLKSNPPVATSTLKIGSTGTSVGKSIYYREGYVYLGLSNTASGPAEFNIIDVHNPLSPALVGNASIGNDVNGIFVNKTNAYIASPNVNDLMKFDVSVNKISMGMVPVSTFSGTGGLHGKSVDSVGDTVYLGRTFGTNELYILGATTTLTELGHIDTGSSSGTSINSILNRDYLTFTMNTSGQFQIWRTDTLPTITRFDSIPLSVLPSVSGNNTPLDCEENLIYIGTTDASNKGYVSVISASP